MSWACRGHVVGDYTGAFLLPRIDRAVLSKHTMPINLGSTQCGLLVIDTRGTVIHSVGSFRNPAIASTVVDAWRRAVADGRRVLSVRVEHDALCVVGLTCEHISVLVGMERSGPGALFDFVASVPFASDVLEHLLTSPYEAMVVVDESGRVRYLSPVHEEFFGLQGGEAVGRHVTEIIENTRLHEVVRTARAEVGQALEIRGTTRIVNRMPIANAQGRIVGAVGQVMFKDPRRLEAMNSEVGRLRSEVDFVRGDPSAVREGADGIDQIVGESFAIRRLKDQIRKLAPLDVPVLIVGESGTGKELVAHALHTMSARSSQSMVVVNAAALPPDLIESELFGYEGGAFTGAARKGRKGRFEQADRGTLFLDEIGDMPIEMQVKLLRVLQDGRYDPLGAERARSSNFRLISASHRDFEKMIRKGTFRLDLFYRISLATLHVPALRDRTEDIPLLVDRTINTFCARHRLPAKRLAEGVMVNLQRRPWPGNVRQLVHAVERALIFSAEIVELEDFEMPMIDATNADMKRAPLARGVTARQSVAQVEESIIRESMQRLNGNKKRVAEELGVSRSYLYKRLAEFAED